MKQQDSSGVLAGEFAPSLAAFKGRDKDKDKDSSSLPFPSSVLLTRPVGTPSSIESDFPSMQPAPKKDQNHHHISNSSNNSNNSVSLPSLTSIFDNYVKPHHFSNTPQQYAPPHRTTPSPPTPTTPVASHAPHTPSYGAATSVERLSHTPVKTQEKKDILSQRDLVHQQILKHQQQQQQQQQHQQQQHQQQQQTQAHAQAQAQAQAHIQQHYLQQYQQHQMQQLREQQLMEQQMMEQQLHEQHLEKQREQQRELRLREQQLLREQEMREQQQRELRNNLREQLQQHRRNPPPQVNAPHTPHASHAPHTPRPTHDGDYHSYPLPPPFARDQYDVHDYQQRHPEGAYLQPKRESPPADVKYPEHKLTVREQLKLNLLQRDPSLGEAHEDQKRRIPPRVTPLKPPSTPTAPSTPKHAGGFTQHMFVVPSSPLSGSSPLHVPTTPNSKHSPNGTAQSHFDATKFTNYTSQEFQKISPPAPSTPTSASLLAPGNGVKWSNQWGSEKDVYKQAKSLSNTLQNNVRLYQDNTQAVPTTPTTPSTPNGSILPPFSHSPQPHTVPIAPSTPTAPSTPRSAPRAPFSPTSNGSSQSGSNKRKAATDANITPPKVQATTLTPAQLELQKEAQLFSSKDIKAGLQRFNNLLSNSNHYDIYNKFNKTDEYSLCHTKAHQPSVSSSPSETAATSSPTPSS